VILLPLVVLVPLALTWRGEWDGIGWRATLLLLTLIPNVAIWGTFNPLQQTTVMFEKPDTAITRSLDELASTRPDGAIAAPGFFGAVPNGVGYRSVSHFIQTPSPQVFRKYFPNMSQEEFDLFFNRNMVVSLTNEKEPIFVAGNNVGLPIGTMRRYAATP
jgi:hypothetical protein